MAKMVSGLVKDGWGWRPATLCDVPKHELDKAKEKVQWQLMFELEAFGTIHGVKVERTKSRYRDHNLQQGQSLRQS